ncbi:hypothetical protein BSMD_043320 [Bacillus subtilis Miyagi-4]|nr:hypothetical protein BSNT_06694 [Bacillus subtilis subsp. natto BEST195]GAK82366.1 hypothetical protein BSMD_043320 [Bacillus subtilis Miyagi-4]
MQGFANTLKQGAGGGPVFLLSPFRLFRPSVRCATMTID